MNKKLNIKTTRELYEWIKDIYSDDEANLSKNWVCVDDEITFLKNLFFDYDNKIHNYKSINELLSKIDERIKELKGGDVE